VLFGIPSGEEGGIGGVEREEWEGDCLHADQHSVEPFLHLDLDDRNEHGHKGEAENDENKLNKGVEERIN
jgi:hypothetical protein